MACARTTPRSRADASCRHFTWRRRPGLLHLSGLDLKTGKLSDAGTPLERQLKTLAGGRAKEKK